MFWNKKKDDIVVGQFSAIDKIFRLKNIRRCKEFVFEIFKFLRKHEDNIAFLQVESKDVNYVIIRSDLYKELVNATLELKAAQEDIYYIKEIVKQMEKEENNT